MRIDKKKPYIAVIILCLLILGCIFAEWVVKEETGYMNLENINQPPSADFYFGTDSLGRDVYAMIWSGGRLSLLIGFTAAVISVVMAVVYGAFSGFAPNVIDNLMMRFLELLLSVPSILMVIFLQALLGQGSPLTLAFVIGMTGWMNMAKVVRGEIRQLRKREYIIQASCMGGGFFYILKRHFVPDLIPAILFMAVTGVGSAIGTESTLSFFGIGLPLNLISWGTMLAGGENAMLSNEWWLIIIPGAFLITLLLCITDIGNYIRSENTKKCSNL